MKRILLLLFAMGVSFGTALAQGQAITGKVISGEDDSPLPGVNVVVKGNARTGTITDINGEFRLEVPGTASTLVFSYIGFKTQEVQINNRTTVNVVLVSDDELLQEIVVTGYGTATRPELTGSISSISKSDIEKLPVSNAASILQGQASGVFVTQQSGTPGGGITVQVRGPSSINGSNTPLYIIDGVPVVSGSLAQNGFGGQQQSALNSVNPQDIASIEVLKDPSVTAIYGARAANGVVLITTKRGTAGATKVDVNVWRGISEVTNRYDMAPAALYADVRRAVGGTNPEVTEWDGVTDTDWLDEVLRPADVTEVQASISGGDSKTRYYLSTSYRDEEAVFIGGGLKRYTGRLNLDHTASDRFTISASILGSSDLNQRIENDNNIFGIVSAAILTPSTVGVRDPETGEYIDALPGFRTNPLRAAERTRADLNTVKIVANTRLSYEIMKGLNVVSDFSYDYNQLTEDLNTPSNTAQGSPDGSGNLASRRLGTWTIEPRVNYDFTVGEKHKVSAIVGSTFLKRRDTPSFVEGNTFPKPELTYLTSAANITGGSSNLIEYAFTSVFGNVRYNFNNKYILNATLRRDGSSRFGSGKKFGNFWSVSGAWNFTEEAFMEGVDFINAGKLKLGYGIVGNDGIGNFAYTGAFTGGNYLGFASFERLQIENPDLQWEESATLDAGFEMDLFDSKVTVGANFFESTTTNLLSTVQLPRTTGFNAVLSNIGEIKNRGLEVDLGYRVVDKPGFSWRINENITFLENEVVDLVSEEPILSGFASAVIEGEPLGTFWGLEWLGVNPATGESEFLDANGDGVITSEDRVVLGDAAPDFFGGFTNTITWKGFTLDVLFQYVGGVDLYNNTMQFMMDPNSAFGDHSDMQYAWQQPGDVTFVPRLDGAGLEFSEDNSRWLDNGDYLRLKNLTISYTLPLSLVQKAKLSKVRVYFTGTNLLTFTNYDGIDPEISTFGFTNTAPGTEFLSVPQTRLYSLGINIGL